MSAPYRKNRFIFATTLLALATTSSPHALIVADELLYSYDGTVHPLSEVTGWIIGNPCEPPCQDSIENGAFTVRWGTGNDFLNYTLFIAFRPAPPPPPPFWIEWSF